MGFKADVKFFSLACINLVTVLILYIVFGFSAAFSDDLTTQDEAKSHFQSGLKLFLSMGTTTRHAKNTNGP